MTSRISLALPLTLALLSGCANMVDTPPDTPLSQIESRFGKPDYSCPRPDGGTRLIWTQQPYGQYAWGGNANAAGVVDKIVPILTDEHFRVLATGQWTPEQVRCEFGPPAEISTTGLPSVREVVWSYRYRENKVWNSLMYVFFGRDGQKVTHFHPGPDPMFEVERFPVM